MRKTVSRMLFVILAVWMCISAFAEEDSAARAPLSLPEGSIAQLSASEDPFLGPKNNRYLYNAGENIPYGYEDPSISVRFGRGRIYDTDYVYARVKIASPYQIRTAMAAKKFPSKTTTTALKQAERVNAVIAVNGDSFSGHNGWGAVIRQGVSYRLKCDGIRDVLIIDDKGDLHILEDAKNEDVEAFDGQIVNALTFGPALVIGGQPKTGVRSHEMATHIPAQRMAIAQVGELEYLLITSEGPDDPGSKGMLLDQFVELVSSFPDVTNAYNLDGGSSSTMVFRKTRGSWEKYNCPKNQKVRSVSDIIYFADAYDAE